MSDNINSSVSDCVVRDSAFVAVRNTFCFGGDLVGLVEEVYGHRVWGLSLLPPDIYQEDRLLQGEDVVFRTSFGDDRTFTAAEWEQYMQGIEARDQAADWPEGEEVQARQWKRAMYMAGAQLHGYRATLGVALWTDCASSRLRTLYWQFIARRTPITIPTMDCLAGSAPEGLGLLRLRHGLGRVTNLLRVVEYQVGHLELSLEAYDPVNVEQQTALTIGVLPVSYTHIRAHETVLELV